MSLSRWRRCANQLNHQREHDEAKEEEGNSQNPQNSLLVGAAWTFPFPHFILNERFFAFRAQLWRLGCVRGRRCFG